MMRITEKSLHKKGAGRCGTTAAFEAFRFTMAFFLLLFIQATNQPVLAQEQPARALEIYKDAYRTALEDGEIDENEAAILASIRRSLGLSEADVQSVISTVRADSGRIDQSGRWLLVGQNMIYGASVYGWMIPDVLGAEDVKWYVGSEMLSLAATFYCTYRLTRHIPLSLSRAQMMRLGSLIGLRYGFGLSTALEIDRDDSDAWQLLVMASVPAGMYLGDRLYGRWRPSHGQSWTLGLGAGMGAFAFRQLYNIFDPSPEESVDESDPERDRKRWDRAVTLIELAGYPLGMYFAHRFWRDKSITFGDGLMLTQGTLTGSVYGMFLGIMLGVDMEDGEAWRLFPVTGGLAGTFLMDRCIAGYDYTTGQSIVSALGTVSGMAFMSGIGVITETTNEKALSAMVTAGGIGGLLLTNTIFDLKREIAGSVPAENMHLTIFPAVQYQGPHKAFRPGLSVYVTF